MLSAKFIPTAFSPFITVPAALGAGALRRQSEGDLPKGGWKLARVQGITGTWNFNDFRLLACLMKFWIFLLDEHGIKMDASSAETSDKSLAINYYSRSVFEVFIYINSGASISHWAIILQYESPIYQDMRVQVLGQAGWSLISAVLVTVLLSRFVSQDNRVKNTRRNKKLGERSDLCQHQMNHETQAVAIVISISIASTIDHECLLSITHPGAMHPSILNTRLAGTCYEYVQESQ
ncbi:hypothetical protein C8J56DRAFT_889366 [Mycena floridula]|nr:hypothetical protein C8J56DRAFT_889366 [Mycena floridula]